MSMIQKGSLSPAVFFTHRDVSQGDRSSESWLSCNAMDCNGSLDSWHRLLSELWNSPAKQCKTVQLCKSKSPNNTSSYFLYPSFA